MRRGLPALPAVLEKAELLVRPARPLQLMPRVTLPLERLVDGVLPLFAEWVHLGEVDPRLGRNLRAIPASRGGPALTVSGCRRAE